MSATQLSIFNKALRYLEERKLANLNEKREVLRYLNDEWSDAILYCLNEGYWKHAIRNVQMNNETNQNPNFGFEYAFLKPDDWLRTYQVADNTVYEPLLRRYDDQNNYWYADITPIYVKYVSTSPSFGLNMGLWPPGFNEYLAAYLAQMLVPRIKQSDEKIKKVDEIVKRVKRAGLSMDAMDLAVGHIPWGSWVQSRAPRGSVTPYGNPFPGGFDD